MRLTLMAAMLCFMALGAASAQLATSVAAHADQYEEQYKQDLGIAAILFFDAKCGKDTLPAKTLDRARNYYFSREKPVLNAADKITIELQSFSADAETAFAMWCGMMRPKFKEIYGPR